MYSIAILRKILTNRTIYLIGKDFRECQDDTIADKIYKLRGRNNIRLEDFAKMIGSTRNIVRRWELGQSNPRKESLEKVCNVFGLDISYFTD